MGAGGTAAKGRRKKGRAPRDDDPSVLARDPEAAAEAAGLRHVSDDEPGLRRRRRGPGWSYHRPDGELIRDPSIRERIEALAVPPAWTDVWICRDPDGHIQATGRDDRGRKQYRYHPRWREVRNAAKFSRLLAFAEALPGIRERVTADLRRKGLPREKVLAAVVRLLECSCIRIGNEEYERENSTYGLTTLRDRHVEFEDETTVRFRYEGKGGKEQEAAVVDRRLARTVRECRDVPGYELFQYFDDDGEKRTVGAAEVNAYLKRIAGAGFTAKDFRTWVGTRLAFEHLRDAGPPEDEDGAEKRCLAAIDHVAERLGNTRAVCREFYVHPGLLELYRRGAVGFGDGGGDSGEGPEGLEPSERALLALLERAEAAVSPSD